MKNDNSRIERQKHDWIRLILSLLERADPAQLRDIYLLLTGYLGAPNN